MRACVRMVRRGCVWGGMEGWDMWGVDGGVGYVGCGWRGGICGVWMEGWDMWGVDGGVGYVGCGWRGGITPR